MTWFTDNRTGNVATGNLLIQESNIFAKGKLANTTQNKFLVEKFQGFFNVTKARIFKTNFHFAFLKVENNF